MNQLQELPEIDGPIDAFPTTDFVNDASDAEIAELRSLAKRSRLYGRDVSRGIGPWRRITLVDLAPAMARGAAFQFGEAL